MARNPASEPHSQTSEPHSQTSEPHSQTSEPHTQQVPRSQTSEPHTQPEGRWPTIQHQNLTHNQKVGGPQSNIRTSHTARR